MRISINQVTKMMRLHQKQVAIYFIFNIFNINYLYLNLAESEKLSRDFEKLEINTKNGK